MKPLIAIEFWEVEPYPEIECKRSSIINNYIEALHFVMDQQDDNSQDYRIEFIEFESGEDIEEYVNDMETYYFERKDYFYDLSDVQKYFNQTTPIYCDGTEISIGDKFSILANQFIWGYIFNNGEVFTGSVISVGNAHEIEVRLDKYPEKRWAIKHYKMSKIYE